MERVDALDLLIASLVLGCDGTREDARDEARRRTLPPFLTRWRGKVDRSGVDCFGLSLGF